MTMSFWTSNESGSWRYRSSLLASIKKQLVCRFDCIILHSLLAELPQTPLVSYGMMHNNESVCDYVFACLEDFPKGDPSLLWAPGIVGEVRETAILCSGLNLQKNKQRTLHHST